MKSLGQFVNRTAELAALERWWRAPDNGLALVWGRRRVGKTWLLAAFAQDRRSITHTGAARPRNEELRILSREVAAAGLAGLRDLERRPFADWDDALEHLVASSGEGAILLILDELPELMAHSPELPSVLRAMWDRAGGPGQLQVALCGSAVRSMEMLQEERAPLFGRFDLRLQVHPFAPHEAALVLVGLDPAEQALVWGLLGGIPLYLSWWDTGAGVAENLRDLVCTPGGRLLLEGELLLATEADNANLGGANLTGAVLRAIATGHTKHGEIADAVRAEPARTLDRLIQLRLVERVAPVTEDPRRTRRRIYRVADNFLRFWLGTVDRYRAEIERGLGPTILPALLSGLDDTMGAVWEEAFRMHLRRMAAAGLLGDQVVAVGPFWREGGKDEIDAVVLAGRARSAIMVGEAKWARQVDARRVEATLLAKAASLPSAPPHPRAAIAARESVLDAAPDTLAITAASIFDPAGL